MSRLHGRLALATGLTLVAWGAVGASVPAPPYLGERLEYTASYEGLLSGGQQVDVAEVVLSTQRRPTRFNGEPAYKTTVRASTGPYEGINRVYPLRYEYNSLLSADLQRCLMFDQRRDGRKERHKVVWFDWNEHRVARLRRGADDGRGNGGGLEAVLDDLAPRGMGQGEPLRSQAMDAFGELGIIGDEDSYEARAVSVPTLPDRLFDRLAMLQVLRLSDLDGSSSLHIPVTDGEKLMSYRVEILGRERVHADVDGQGWDTYHLRLSAVEAGDAGPGEDSAVDLWLATDSTRTPVRLSSEHRLGRFEIRLRGAGGAVGGADDAADRVVGVGR
ncbi:MAG: DUF3108 domain-containing protein [Chromatiales bacterium]